MDDKRADNLPDAPEDDSGSFYGPLKVLFPIAVPTPQEPGNDKTAKRSQSMSGGMAQGLAGLLQQFSSAFQQSGASLFGAGGLFDSHRFDEPRIKAPTEPAIFTAPEGQNVFLAEEITGPVKGICDEDSYLFITQNACPYDHRSDTPGWRAFVVSKRDPTKQHEIAISNVGFGEPRGQIHATLGNGHELSLSSVSASGALDGVLDGVSARGIWGREYDKLVKQQAWRGGTHDTSFSTEYIFTGESWIIMRKDLASGRIERFTQDGRSNLGRLEIIQGDSCGTKEEVEAAEKRWDADYYKGLAHWDTCPTTRWLYNGETKRTPQTSSMELASLPDDMKEDVLFRLQMDNEMANTSGGGIQTRANAALNGVLPDHAEVFARVQQENRNLVAENNAAEHSKRGSDPKSLLQPY
jgi:hypothetical protein